MLLPNMQIKYANILQRYIINYRKEKIYVNIKSILIKKSYKCTKVYECKKSYECKQLNKF